MKTMIIAIRATVVTLVLTGLLYPFAMTGLAQVLFPWRANGSLVTDEKGQVVGSQLIGQGFANPAYFQPRPYLDGRIIRKGAVDAIIAYVGELGGTVSSQIEGVTHGIADSGGTPLVVCRWK